MLLTYKILRPFANQPRDPNRLPRRHLRFVITQLVLLLFPIKQNSTLTSPLPALMLGTNIFTLRPTRIALRSTLSASCLKGNQTLCIPRIRLAPQLLEIQVLAICDLIDRLQGAATLELLVHVLILLHSEVDANVVYAFSEFRQINVDEVANIARFL